MIGQRVPVLFVEDDAALRDATLQALELEGFTVTAFGDADAALRQLGPDFPGVVVSDVRLPGIDGIEFYRQLRELDAEMAVIFTTAHGDVDMAVNTMKDGAADFFTKPYSVARLVRAIEQAGHRRFLVLENRKLRAELRNREFAPYIGSSQQAERLRRTIADVAAADVDMLVTGNAGAGKTFVAGMIHHLSPRRDRPLVTLDAGVFAHEDADLLVYGRDPSVARSRSGLIERANGGTLVIDAIEQIPERARAGLVSLIEHRSFLAIGAERRRTVNLRIVATCGAPATGQQAADGALLHRLGGITIALPDLAQRQEDVPALFRHFVTELETGLGTSAGQIGAAEWHHLMTHDWPGNLHELRGFARNFVLGLNWPTQAGPAPAGKAGLRDLTDAFERAVLEQHLRRAKGNIAQVMANLCLPRKTLYDKLARHDLKPQDYRA